MKINVKHIIFILLISTLLHAQKESISSENSESKTVQTNSPQKTLQKNVLINKKGLIDTTDNINIDPTLINDIPSSLEIITIPDSTSVILDDKLLGRSPLTVNEVIPGKHTIFLKKAGYFAKKITINVPPGIQNKLEFTMEKPSILKITSEPSSSMVYINKENKGSTPFINKQLKGGNYNLILLKEGYKKSEQDLILEAGKSDSIHIVLKTKDTDPPETAGAKNVQRQKENSKLKSVFDKIALGIFTGFSLIILLIELSQDN